MRQAPYLVLSLLIVTLCAGRMITDNEREGGFDLKPADYMAAVTAKAFNATNGTSGNCTKCFIISNTTANSTKGGNTTIPTNQKSGGNSTKGGNSTNSTRGNSTKPGNSTNNNSTKPGNGTNGTANVAKTWLKYNNTCFGCVVSGFKYCSQSRTCISLAENCTGKLT